MLVLTSFAFSLDKAAAQQVLEQEQAVAAKYQTQKAINKKIIDDMTNEVKNEDYKKRLSQLRYRKYILEFDIKRTHTIEETEKLMSQLDSVIAEYTTLLREYEIFVATLS
jgi:hypothetical protein